MEKQGNAGCGFLILIIIVGLLYWGFSWANTPSQYTCLKQDGFEYSGECKDWSEFSEISYEDQKEVVDEMAEEIADERGISKQQALEELYEITQKYGE